MSGIELFDGYGRFIGVFDTLFDVWVECLFRQLRIVQVDGTDKLTGWSISGRVDMRMLDSELPVQPYLETMNGS
jgi:hypothetical protein